MVIYYQVKANRYDKLFYSFIGNMPTNNLNTDYVINEFNNEIEVLKPENEFNYISSIELDFHRDDSNCDFYT